MTHNMQSVFYDLLDQHNRIITSDSVEVDINKPISELKRAVFSENDNQLPGCKAVNLHIYPPGTTDYSGQSISAKTRIHQLLSFSQPDDSIILVARPPSIDYSKFTYLIVIVRWNVNDKLVHLPLRIQVHVDGTILDVENEFKKSFQQAYMNVDWLSGRQMTVQYQPYDIQIPNKDSDNKNVSLKDLNKNDKLKNYVWQQLYITLGPTPQNTPTKHSAPSLDIFQLTHIPAISRIRRAHYIYRTLHLTGRQVCMLYAPPKCGKTILISQLSYQFKLIGDTHQLIASHGDGATQIFQYIDTRQLFTTLSPVPTLLVIDEVQCTYDVSSNNNNDKFWISIKNFIDRAASGASDNPNLFVILIAAYGGDTDTRLPTPTDIVNKFNMKDVLMNDSELDDLVMAYSTVSNSKPISDNLQQIIKSRLGFHIGLTVELLEEYCNLRTNADESELTYQLLAGDISRHLLWYRGIQKLLKISQYLPKNYMR